MKFWETGETAKTDEFNYEEMKRKFIENLDYLRTMSVEEQTLYKKWMEWNEDLIGNMKKLPVLQSHYDSLWKPTDIMNKELTIAEIQAIDPYVEIVDDDAKQSTRWTEIRRLIHTMEFQANPGRNVKCYVKDRTSGKILGQICLGSDITSLGVRDAYIGWQKDDKFKNGKLNCTTIATTIVSTQPFGYNFLGGKLVAALITTSKTREIWKKLYGEELVGMTTTSLYGSYSMYNSLKWWHKCGSSTGKMTIKADDSVYDVWHQWIKDNKSEQYNKAMTQKEGVNGPVTGAKNRIISMIFQTLKIKASDYTHGYERGVYYSCFYENTKEFLQNKISEKELKLKELFKKDVQGVFDWWKPKAIERYKKLHSEGNIKSDILFYNKMIGMTYDEAKSKFFDEVGR